MPHCSDIVILPRLKWIEGSKDTGKDNHAWYRFDVRHSGGPVLHNNRGQDEVIPSRRIGACEQCRKLLRAAAIQFAVLLAGVQAACPSQEA